MISGKFVALAAVLLASSTTLADIVVTVPANTDLLPDTPDQMVQVAVTSMPSDTVTAFSLNAAIDNTAMPSPVFQGPGPATGADFATGTVWTASTLAFSVNTSAMTGIPLPFAGLENFGQVGVSFDESGESMSGFNGTLVTLKIDTTGIFGGTFPLVLGGLTLPQFTFPASRFFNGAVPIAATYNNGSITIVPEPGAWMLCLLVLGGFTAPRFVRRLRGLRG